ncbi:MAG: hypothetical protein K0S23_273 [Fluviicola sp.]|jgi:hypothetical protein|uniref:hypothetical protein n=1 Tax=Fluviicola sp. TaxID=1917219 RepID=UPI002628E302|nr:hypothetical protein [Fluviicola sp.]MDF3025966.1 hypothetical protein [Fluviicola sp.]
MKSHLLKSLLLIFALSQNPLSFSQNNVKGTYHLVYNPKDALRIPKDSSDGALKFPVYGNKMVLKLKGRNKLECIVTDLDGANKWVTYGEWSIVGKTLKLEHTTLVPPVTQTFEFIKLKSGDYIKPVNQNFHYYKKE